MTLTPADRLDLLAQARVLAAAGSRMAHLVCVLTDEAAAKDDMIRGLCDRVEAQSQLLAKRAEVKP